MADPFSAQISTHLRLQDSARGSLVYEELYDILLGIKTHCNNLNPAAFNTELSKLCAPNVPLRQFMVALICKTSVTNVGGFFKFNLDNMLGRLFDYFIVEAKDPNISASIKIEKGKCEAFFANKINEEELSLNKVKADKDLVAAAAEMKRKVELEKLENDKKSSMETELKRIADLDVKSTIPKKKKEDTSYMSEDEDEDKYNYSFEEEEKEEKEREFPPTLLAKPIAAGHGTTFESIEKDDKSSSHGSGDYEDYLFDEFENSKEIIEEAEKKEKLLFSPQKLGNIPVQSVLVSERSNLVSPLAAATSAARSPTDLKGVITKAEDEEYDEFNDDTSTVDDDYDSDAKSHKNAWNAPNFRRQSTLVLNHVLGRPVDNSVENDVSKKEDGSSPDKNQKETEDISAIGMFVKQLSIHANKEVVLDSMKQKEAQNESLLNQVNGGVLKDKNGDFDDHEDDDQAFRKTTLLFLSNTGVVDSAVIQEEEEKERREKDRIEKEKADALERETLEKEMKEKEKIEKAKIEKVRVEKEKARLEKEKAEKERVEKEKAGKEILEKERADKERIEKESVEKARLEKEIIEKENERLEKARLEKEMIAKARLEKERKEKERVEKERVEKERIRTEREEKAILEKEKMEKERVEKERLAVKIEADCLTVEKTAAKDAQVVSTTDSSAINKHLTTTPTSHIKSTVELNKMLNSIQHQYHEEDEYDDDKFDEYGDDGFEDDSSPLKPDAPNPTKHSSTPGESFDYSSDFSPLKTRSDEVFSRPILSSPSPESKPILNSISVTSHSIVNNSVSSIGVTSDRPQPKAIITSQDVVRVRPSSAAASSSTSSLLLAAATTTTMMTNKKSESNEVTAEVLTTTTTTAEPSMRRPRSAIAAGVAKYKDKVPTAQKLGLVVKEAINPADESMMSSPGKTTTTIIINGAVVPDFNPTKGIWVLKRRSVAALKVVQECDLFWRNRLRESLLRLKDELMIVHRRDINRCKQNNKDIPLSSAHINLQKQYEEAIKNEKLAQDDSGYLRCKSFLEYQLSVHDANVVHLVTKLKHTHTDELEKLSNAIHEPFARLDKFRAAFEDRIHSALNRAVSVFERMARLLKFGGKENNLSNEMSRMRQEKSSELAIVAIRASIFELGEVCRNIRDVYQSVEVEGPFEQCLYPRLQGLLPTAKSTYAKGILIVDRPNTAKTNMLFPEKEKKKKKKKLKRPKSASAAAITSEEIDLAADIHPFPEVNIPIVARSVLEDNVDDKLQNQSNIMNDRAVLSRNIQSASKTKLRLYSSMQQSQSHPLFASTSPLKSAAATTTKTVSQNSKRASDASDNAAEPKYLSTMEFQKLELERKYKMSNSNFKGISTEYEDFVLIEDDTNEDYYFAGDDISIDTNGKFKFSSGSLEAFANSKILGDQWTGDESRMKKKKRKKSKKTTFLGAAIEEEKARPIDPKLLSDKDLIEVQKVPLKTALRDFGNIRSTGGADVEVISCCSKCEKTFVGEGKLIPTTASMDSKATESFRSKQKELIMKAAMFDNLDKHQKKSIKEMLLRRQQSGHKPGENRVFCSWVCMKRWVLEHMPIAFRYNTCVLIDLNAGRIIDA